MMMPMAASGAVSMPVSMNGRSIASKCEDAMAPMSCPPSRMPRMMDAMVSPSIQPLALTSCEAGSSSVRMPYLAGEYAAAPKPTTAYAISGCEPNSIMMQPTILMALLTNITRPLGRASAKAPTNGASTT